MEYSLNLNPRPFEAIKKGTKKIEGRVPVNDDSDVPFDKFNSGDILVFTNNENGGIMKTKVLGVRHYKDAKTMLETEGVENVLSSGGDVKQGIESYNKLNGYKKGVKKYGIYAIEIAKV